MKRFLRITLLLLISTLSGGGYALAQDETITLSAQNYSNKTDLASVTTTGTNCSISYAKNKGSNSPMYYTEGTAARLYSKNSFTVSSATKKITKLTLTFSGSNKPTSEQYKVSSGTLDVTQTAPVWTSESTDGVSSITITNTASSGHWRLQKVAVTYAAETGKTATTLSFDTLNTKKMAVNETFATPSPTLTAGEETLTGKTITYSSSDTKVATVDESTGVVTAVALGSATITASYAGDDTYSASSASYDLTVMVLCKTIEDMQNTIDNNSSSETTAELTFSNIYVTAVKGSNAYISDGEYGMVIYASNHGLNQGDILNGTINATLCMYNGAYEIKNFSSTGLTITKTTLTPIVTTLDKITKANEGQYVKVEKLTYSSNTFTDTSSNTITYYDGLGTSPKLETNGVYDVTGIVHYMKALELLPTSVVESGKLEPTLKTGTTPANTLNIGDTETYDLTYVGDGTVSVKSSNESAATATYDATAGTVTVKALAKGTTTITISATEGTKYGTPSDISFSVKVTDPIELTAVFNYTDDGIKGAGTSGGGGGFTVTKEAITLKTNKAYGADAHLKIYGSSSTTDPTKASTVTFTAQEGYIITGIELTATGTTYVQTWKDQNGTSLNVSDTQVSWTGLMPSVTITNQSTKQGRFTQITVNYIKLTDTGNTVTISEAGKGTYCASENCVVGDGTVTKYITGTEENGTTLTEADAQIVAKGEGVLLNGAAGDYKVYTHTRLNPTANANNKLKGCTDDTSYVPNGCYVMQNQNNCVAFYIVSTDTFKGTSGKAYLDLGTSEAKALFFGDSEATGINSTAINGADAQQDIYTLSGMKVNKANMTKGIYIVNGKKYIVK